MTIEKARTAIMDAIQSTALMRVISSDTLVAVHKTNEENISNSVLSRLRSEGLLTIAGTPERSSSTAKRAIVETLRGFDIGLDADAQRRYEAQHGLLVAALTAALDRKGLLNSH